MFPFPVLGRAVNRGLGSSDGGDARVPIPMATRISALSNVIGYWKEDEPTGIAAADSSGTGANGVYSGAFTLDQTGIGDGSKSTLFSGGRISLAATLGALNAVFDPLKGTIFCWAKVANAGVWTDGVSRILIELGADANNRVFLFKNNTNNIITCNHIAGGTTKQGALAFSSLNWFSTAMTWDKAADQMKFYVNGVQQGATLTGLGVWVGTLNSGFSAIADFTSAGSANGHSGNEAHVMVRNVVSTPEEMAYIGIL